MKRILFSLKPQMEGAEVGDLQAALKLFPDQGLMLQGDEDARQGYQWGLSMGSESIDYVVRVGWGECNELQHLAPLGFTLGFLRHPNLRFCGAHRLIPELVTAIK